MKKDHDQIFWARPATLPEVDRICAEMALFLKNYALDPKDLFAIELLLREALTNAVVHGSGENPENKISCHVQMSEKEIILQVLDQGKGFDWRSHRSAGMMPAGLQENVSETGRGLEIYKLYTSSFSFNQAGNCVTLRRRFQKGEPSGRE